MQGCSSLAGSSRSFSHAASKMTRGCCCVYVKEKKQRQTCISTELAKLLGCFITSMGSSSVTALVTFLEFNVAVKECGLALKM